MNMFTTDGSMLAEIPDEIIKAAQTVDNWMHEHRYYRWELMGICSRNHAYKLHQIHGTLEMFYALIDDEYKCSESPRV